MLENFSPVHQGMGLHGQPGASAPASLRVVAMLRDSASDPDGSNEQALLWPVCDYLQRLGHPVLVLDGSQSERADMPGLEQLLEQSIWQARTGLHPDPQGRSVAVLPARQGLALLDARARKAGTTCTDWLQRHMRGFALLMIYADADTLVRILPNEAVQPLMVLPDQGPLMLGCYRQLKQLAVQAGLHCVLASLRQAHDDDGVAGYDWKRKQSSVRSRAQDEARNQAQIDALRQCAQRHMGHEPELLTVRAQHAPDLQRLALHLLNHACSVMPHGSQTLAAGFAPLPAYSVWSH
ncbi:hypothetical protein [Delftia sp. PS-11]|uniref:hypothetical protein n=1 Tax=Delftia sp. PS-11 TaxID=2767222 RepID=UPI0024548DBF|nr:hypothetical protein [Delftia sp. PS-11]KAJ8746220.1 hypothetical protein H9T68_03685 [Delftia sp. PS-11]